MECGYVSFKSHGSLWSTEEHVMLDVIAGRRRTDSRRGLRVPRNPHAGGIARRTAALRVRRAVPLRPADSKYTGRGGSSSVSQFAWWAIGRGRGPGPCRPDLEESRSRLRDRRALRYSE